MKPFRPLRSGAAALAVALFAASFSSCGAAIAAPTPPPISWDSSKASRLNALVQDRRGRLFVATEEQGVWMRNRQGAWTQFNAAHSLVPDDIVTCLATDGQGRVWAGTARSGVAIYNGRSWKPFGALKGAFGEHIFDIAVNAADGDVWLATNEGLTRYSPSSDQWRFYSRADGLKTDKVQAIAFTARGDIVLGTQAHGVWMGRAQKDAKGFVEYSNWRGTTTWDMPGDTPTGSGLPSNLINDVLVGRDGTIWAATTAGLAWSRDNGQTWRYGRGRDYADKVRGRIGGAPVGWQPKGDAPLLEDYVTALAQDVDGRLYIGHRRSTPYEVWTLNETRMPHGKNAPLEKALKTRVWSGDKDTATATSSAPGAVPTGKPEDFVTAIAPLQDGQIVLARYDGGLAVSKIEAPKTAASQSPSSQFPNQNPPIEYSTGSTVSPYPPFPSPVAVPTLAEINALLQRLSLVPRTESRSQLPVVALSDDWTTRGDWLGRYGRYWANLCAMAPLEFGGDYIWGAGEEQIDYQSRIGLGQDKGDRLRYFVSSLYTNDPNSLEMPPIFLHSRILRKETTWEVNRRQSEIDDHGEDATPFRDSFGTYVSLHIPPGNFVLSLYNFNKDGFFSDNRFRDYRISIRRHSAERNLYDISEFAQQPEWARERIHDFRSGVWKRFLARGPQQITVEVNRNFSYNTILAGITLDQISETPAPYFRTFEQDRVLERALQAQKAARLRETPAIYARHFAPATTEAEAATKLFDTLSWLRLTNPTWWTSESRRYYFALTLWFEAQSQVTNSTFQQVKEDKERQTMTARLGTCYYALRMFDSWEKSQRKVGLTPARDIEKAVRWDEKTTTFSGRGMEVVINQLSVRKQASAQTVSHKTQP